MLYDTLVGHLDGFTDAIDHTAPRRVPACAKSRPTDPQGDLTGRKKQGGRFGKKGIAMANFDGIEIPDDMLESLSGGVLDEVSYNNLKGIVVLCKQSGMSLEATLGALSYLQHTSDGDEINDLIHEFYNA